MVRGARASDHWGVRSFGEQAGQATLERQVVAAGVVALSGALVTAVPAVAPHITSAFQTLIPRVGSGSCAVSPPPRHPRRRDHYGYVFLSDPRNDTPDGPAGPPRPRDFPDSSGSAPAQIRDDCAVAP